MKYKLETIPVWDAIKEESECLLCLLEDKIEEYYLNYYLGSSVMNPETRVKVNDQGFCSTHFKGLMEKNKAHALGLMAHTHLEELTRKISPLLKELGKQGQRSALKGGSTKSLDKAVEKLNTKLESRRDECIICQGVKRTMERYAFTIAWLWKDDPEFRQTFKESRGICLHHIPLQLTLASESLKSKDLGSFCETLDELTEKSLKRLEGEILWYTQKFDAQNQNKDWGTSKDAHRRTIQKLIGPIKKA